MFSVHVHLYLCQSVRFDFDCVWFLFYFIEWQLYNYSKGFFNIFHFGFVYDFPLKAIWSIFG